MSPESKALTVNPKDLNGLKKVSISKLPVVGIIHGAHAMMYGADLYGAYNWRDKDVLASIYYDAIMRHMMCWFEGQDYAPDSKVHHLGHVIACAAILLDAFEMDKLVDDRPLVWGEREDCVADELLKRLSHIIQARKEAAHV